MLLILLATELDTDSSGVIGLALKLRAQLTEGRLFPRKHLALYQERKPKRHATLIAIQRLIITLGHLSTWREVLVVVKFGTFSRGHREGFCLFWRWSSHRVCHAELRKNIRDLIGDLDRHNTTWGQERIANELTLKTEIGVSHRTAKYPDMDRLRGVSDQRLKTIVPNHVKAMVARHSFACLTATFRILRVFVGMAVGSFFERLVGTIRQESLYWVVPVYEAHFLQIFSEWATHYNRWWQHLPLGSGILEPFQAKVLANVHHRKLLLGYQVISSRTFDGSHHEYGLEKEVA